MKSIQAMNDVEFSTWLQNYIDVATANKVELGLTDADIQALVALKMTIDKGIKDAIALQRASKAATEQRVVNRHNGIEQIRMTNLRVASTPTAPTELKQQLGITTRKGPSAPTTPTAPKDLVVRGFDDGQNKLTWNGNGNRPNTTYVIEAMVADATEYTIIGLTTKRRFIHLNQKPGVRVAYRVRAQRSDRISSASNIGIVYN